MLQNTLLSNLSMNLSRMDKLQNQLSTGRKYGHISDDPSALIYGQAARNKLARLDHYQGAVETAQSWLTQAEAGVMELNKVVGAIYEELISAGGVKTGYDGENLASDKQNLAMVIKQMQDHYLDTLNSSFGDRFVFGGYNTPGDWAAGRPAEVKPFTIEMVADHPVPGTTQPQLFFNGFNISQFNGMDSKDFDDMFRKIDLSGLSDTAAREKMLSELGFNDLATGGDVDFAAASGFSLDDAVTMNRLLNDVIEFDVGPGISMPVTQNGIDIVFFVSRENGTGAPIMRNTFDLIQEIYIAINGDQNATPPIHSRGAEELTLLIGEIQGSQNHLLTRVAEIGGRQRRLELLEARYAQDNLNYERMRSDAEDADMAEVIMFLKMAETVYQAALSAGARVIQPTLMDFLR
jgi:flagellar hook-associated protein 3 FlgL